MEAQWEIRDPIHGYIKVNEIEKSLIDTIYLQRMKRIKQLGMTHLVYPGAEHSRFTHSLGTMHLAGEIGEGLRRQGLIDGADCQDLRVAGLLHDIGHGPFSHVFEGILHRVRGMTHEDVTAWLIRESGVADILSSHGLDPRRIAEIVTGRLKGGKAFLGEVIHGPFCADILDYLVRDAHFTGVEYGRIDASRIIGSLSVVDGRLAVDVNSLYAVEAYVIARYEMFKAVYFHRTARAAEIMIDKAMELADEDLGLTSFQSPEDYVRLTDAYVVEGILSGRVERAREIVEDLLERRLLKMTYEHLFHTKDTFFLNLLEKATYRDSLLDRISQLAKVPREKVFFDYPSLPSVPHYPIRGDLPAYLREDGRRVLVSVPALSSLIASLSGYMNIIRIYATEDVREDVERVIKDVLGDLMGGSYTDKISY